MKNERDFIGYGIQIPQVKWPNHAKIALNFVLNYEEGSELNVLDNDDESESYLTDLPGAHALKGARHLSVESLFEYGSRVGIWRLLRLFQEHTIDITVFATGLALERNIQLTQWLKETPHEIAGHGYRWINYANIDEEEERQHIQKTLHIVKTLTDKQVYGWYTGRRSSFTRKLIIEAGLLYDSDSYADDLPYWIHLENKKHLIIPYVLDTNDLRFATNPGWSTGEDFFAYLKNSFDELYFEGEENPKMMTVGLHARLSGHPGRARALRQFIEYIKKFERVWICRRCDIANHWYKLG